MISKAAAVKKVSDDSIDLDAVWSKDKNKVAKNDAKAGVRVLKKEYRRNMRKLAKPHVDVFTSSIAVNITDDNAENNPTSQIRLEKNTPIVQTVASASVSTVKESTVNESAFTPSADQHLENKKDSIVTPASSKKPSLKYVLIAIGGLVTLLLIGAICSSLFKSCGTESSSDEALIETELSDNDLAPEQNELIVEESSDELMPNENEDHIFDGEYKYVGTINEKTPITMALVINGKDVSGKYYYGSGSNGSIALSGTREGTTITMIETTADGKNTGKFVGEIDGLSFYGIFTNLSSGKESPFSVDQDDPNEADGYEAVEDEVGEDAADYDDM